MTQFARAGALLPVPHTKTRDRTIQPVRRRPRRGLSARLASVASLLALAGLAGCADTLTDASEPLRAPRMEVSGSEFRAEYSIPGPANSLLGTSTVPWTFTGIMVPRAGKYRIRVQGFVNVAKYPTFPGPCPQSVFTDYLGDWGPMGRPALGTALRVGIYTQPAVDFGFPVKVIDGSTIETEQQLNAFDAIWVGRNGLGVQVMCTGLTEPLPMFAFSGSQILTVTEIPAPKLECKGPDGNTEIERGQTVRCTITPDKPYKVLTRRASATGFSIAEEPGTTHAANTQYVWEGPAVTNTQVQMVIETEEEGGTKQTTHTAAYTVRAREWPKLQLSAPVVTVGISGSLQTYPANKVLGNARPHIPQTTIDALPVTRPTAGPNTGLSFLTNPLPAISHSIHLHPGLYNNPATPTSPDQQWRRDQDGNGSGDCTSSVFSDLTRRIERHEGVTQADNSHWGITARFFRDSEAEQRIEELYKNGDEAALRRDVRTTWLGLITTGPHKTQQTNFDKTDYPKIDAALGCALDYNLSDT